MKIYRLSLTIDDEVAADDIDEAFEHFRTRFDGHMYGPTKEHIEDTGETVEAA